MFQILADNVTGDAGAEDSVESNKTPFLPGRTVETIVATDGATGTAPDYSIEGSDNDSDWTVLQTIDSLGTTFGSVKCYKYMRFQVNTAAGTADGTVSCALRSGD